MSIRRISAVLIAFPLAASNFAGSLPSLAQGNIKSSKITADVLCAEASRLNQANDPLQALRKLEAAISLAPQRPDLQVIKARLLLQQQKAHEAEQVLRKTIKMNPNYAEAHAAMADVLWTLKQPGHSVREADQAVALNPKCVQYRDLKCGFLFALQSLEAALAESDKALELDPKYAHIHNTRSRILAAMNRPKEALAEISKAIELDPSQADYHDYRANLLLAEDRPADAEKEARIAVKLAPGNRLRKNTLLRSLSAQKKWTEAKSLALKLISAKADRPNNEFISWSARDLLAAGAGAEAVQILDYAIQTSRKDSSDLLVCRIGIFCGSGNGTNAVRDTRIYMERSRDPDKDSMSILNSLRASLPVTVAHSQCLSEIVRLLLRRRVLNEAEHVKISRLVRALTLEQDTLLTGLCNNCSGEKQAFQLLSEIASLERRRPLSQPLYYALARLLIRSANLTQAYSCVAHGLKYYPKSISLLELRASLNTALGRKQEAQGDVEKIKREGRDYYTTHLAAKQSNSLVTQLSAFINDDAQAVHEVLQRALNDQREKLLSSKDAQTKSRSLLGLAQLEIADKKYLDALEHIEEAVKLTGKSALSCEVSSWALEGLGRHKEASEARSQAVLLYHQGSTYSLQ